MNSRNKGKVGEREAAAESLRLRDRKPLAWPCRDSDGKRIIYPVAPCRTKREAMAITEAQGYAIDQIPVYE